MILSGITISMVISPWSTTRNIFGFWILPVITTLASSSTSEGPVIYVDNTLERYCKICEVLGHIIQQCICLWVHMNKGLSKCYFCDLFPFFCKQIPMLWHRLRMQNVVACWKEINFFLWDSIVKMFVGCLNYVNMKTAYEAYGVWLSVCLSSFLKTS